jgi:hypothetical protein
MNPSAATRPRLAAGPDQGGDRLVDRLGLEGRVQCRVHLAEYAGGSDQHGDDAKNGCDGPGGGIAGSFQDGFDEVAAGRTQQLAELLADGPAGGVLPKDQTRDRHHDQKHRGQRRRGVERDSRAAAQASFARYPRTLP